VSSLAEEMELVEAEIVEEDDDGRLPQLADRAELGRPRDEMRTAALVAAGGVVAGVATVAAVQVVRSGAKRLPLVKRGKKGGVRDGIVASRSFLIDVHVLGR